MSEADKKDNLPSDDEAEGNMDASDEETKDGEGMDGKNGEDNDTKDGEGTGDEANAGEGTEGDAKGGEDTGNEANTGEGTVDVAKDGEDTGNEANAGEGTGNDAKDGEGTTVDVAKDGEDTGNDAKAGEGTGNEENAGEDTGNDAKDGEDTEGDAKAGEGTGNEENAGEDTGNDAKDGEDTVNDAKDEEGIDANDDSTPKGTGLEASGSQFDESEEGTVKTGGKQKSVAKAKSVKGPVEEEQYGSVGGHAIGFDDVLEADSDFAKAFAQQIGLDDDESEKNDDDGEEEEEEGEDWDEDVVIRDANLLISQPAITEHSVLPRNLLEFRYSFGFDCAKPYNLCVLDPDTVVLTAGSMIMFFKISKSSFTFRRSFSGRGLGFIAKHPHLPHFAVGEKGKEPHIIIYEWPAISLVALLSHGTRRAYAHLDYSPTGELLCSQGGSPDYLFTVWNWKKEKIMLRTRSSNTDVLNSRFSLYMPGHITTGGMGHIKFWKMCKTFTGLKLKGSTGRFGKTEISDVMGIFGMPDEKVVSGCNWGNILIWEAGLIKFEVTRKTRLKCHEGAITQFEFQNGELMTAGKDGFVKSWYYETIDTADPPDEDRFVEVEPMFELEVADHHGPASIVSMARVKPTVKGDTSWYAQDANGGLWLLNLAMTTNATPPKRLYACHSGQIIGLQPSPISQHFASLDTLGKLHLWDINTSQLLAIKLTPFPGSSLLWLPEDMAPCGCVLLAGLSDGGVRAYAVNLADAAQSTKSVILDPGSERLFTLTQFVKPHTGPVLFMDISTSHQYILTVSSDMTAFVFGAEKAGVFCNLRPIGFIRLPNIPTYLSRNALSSSVFYVGCVKGEVVEINIPENPTHNIEVSYEFTDPNVIRILQVKSIKSQILRDLYLEAERKRKDEKLQEKLEKLAYLKEENPGLDLDEEQFLADSEEEEELPPLYVPPEIGSINVISPASNDPDAVWVLLGGYDCGYFYKYRFGKEEPEWWAPFTDSEEYAEDSEVCVGTVNESRTLMFGGLGDGKIVIAPMQTQISPSNDHWTFGMHHGKITKLILSRNEDYLLSAGEDVNIFSYKINAPPEFRSTPKPTVAVSRFAQPPVVHDVFNLSEPSLEQASGKREYDRRIKEASARKSSVEHVLFNLAEQFNKLKRRNRALPKSQVIPREELELDPRITEDRQRTIAVETEDVKRQHEYDLEKARMRFRKLEKYLTKSHVNDLIIVKGIKKNISVRSLRHSSRALLYASAKLALQLKIEEDALKRGEGVDLDSEDFDKYAVVPPAPVESFLRGISAFEHRFSSRLRRLLEKYRSRAAKKEQRKIEWATFMAKMPDVNKNDPEDEARIAEAERTIGDYKLKSDSKYKVPKHLIATTVSKCQELLTIREELDNLIDRFDDAVRDLHQEKLNLIRKMNDKVTVMKRIHEELKPNLRKPIPHVPSLLDEKDANQTAHLRFTEAAVIAERDEMTEKRKPVRNDAPPDHFFTKDPFAEAIFATVTYLVYPGHFLTNIECEDVSGEIPEMHLIDSANDASVLLDISSRDDNTTPYEKEIRLKRVLWRTWEQDNIIKEIAKSIADFDDAVEKMSEKRLIAFRDVILMHQKIVALTQELNIIKACESREDFLMSRVTEKQVEEKSVLQQIANLTSRMEVQNKGILRSQDKQKQIVSSFVEAIGENSFKDYLRKIFKKKSKPPKGEDDSSSESSSSSSSEEEDNADAQSLDSKEFQAIRFDENVCPPGCPHELYELTFTLRSERHEAEKEMANRQREVEMLKKEQDGWNKKLKVIESSLQDNLEDLELFQREKQRRLNEVDTVVILKLSQMKHVKPDGTFLPMKDTLVFDTSMLAYLGKRVGQLHIEANVERERHRKNRRHLSRMIKDVHFMENRLKQLKEGIVEAQYNKFGQLMKVEELESALLKRCIYELRINVGEIQKDFQGLIRSIKETVREKYQELIQTVENNTDLQNLLLTLTEEKNKLFLRNEVNDLRSTRATGATIDEKEFQKDIEKLREISKTMCDRRNALLQELVRLRQKGSTGAFVELTRSAPEYKDGQTTSEFHSKCVPGPFKPPPWPPRVLPANDTSRDLGVLRAPEKQPTPTESSNVDMWERLKQDMDLENPTYWPDHTDPTKKHKISMESIGEGFVFQTIKDLPPINEEDVLAAHFVRDDEAPLFTVVGGRVQVVGQPEEEVDIPVDESSTDVEDYDIEKLESTTELFQRVPSSEIEGAIGDLVGTLSAGETSGGETSGGKTSGGKTSGGETSGGETSGGETSGGETSGGETSGGETSGGKTSGGKTSGGKTSGGETSGGETSGGETSGGETSGGETSGGKTSAGEAGEKSLES